MHAKFLRNYETQVSIFKVNLREHFSRISEKYLFRSHWCFRESMTPSGFYAKFWNFQILKRININFVKFQNLEKNLDGVIHFRNHQLDLNKYFSGIWFLKNCEIILYRNKQLFYICLFVLYIMVCVYWSYIIFPYILV